MLDRGRVLTCVLALAAAAVVSCRPHAPAAEPSPPKAGPGSTTAGAPAAAAPASAPPALSAPPARKGLPSELSDDEFWALSNQLSEPGGTFRSDNLLSNEVWLQDVIPTLLTLNKPGRVYMGVGPEQNFTYIANLKPAMAFIVDIRRGNLDLHLMYKAIFDMSADRADFVSLLFSRLRPAGLTATSSADEIFKAFATVPEDAAQFEKNYTAIIDNLSKTHHFALEPGESGDAAGIRFVYEFFGKYGPDLTYWMSGGGYPGGRGFGGRNSPTYADLMVAEDGNGLDRSFLANDENFKVLKTLEARNLLVPVVGNFAGPKAIRATGEWIRQHDALVSAFYLSNVEQYLQMDAIWTTFCQNAATLPVDDNSQFIRSYRGRGGPGFGYGGGSLDQGISPMRRDLSVCAAAGFVQRGR